MKENKSIDATPDLLDFLCDEENQEELRKMEKEWNEMTRIAMWIGYSISGVVGGLIFLKMVWR